MSPRAEDGTLLSGLPGPSPAELMTPLAQGSRFRLLRIVSTGQATPPGEWYDQADHEWVLLVSGRAGVRVEGGTTRDLRPGDWMMLPAGLRHRVEWTDPDGPTVWLALHFDS